MLEEMAEKELEEQVLEAGNKLLKVPADVDELLALLDKVEGLLSKVEQSPIKSMQNALSPTMNALVSSELLSHKNTDVKVSVAACVSEITRITAPEAPYNDDQMKQIFQVIVESFEMLGDNFCRSYEKRVSILETVAKVRSCVVMLDLECDGLILQMFNYFLKAIRDHHTENVFTSMETIMSLVLEESEEISPPLLHPLLTSVKKEDQAILPVARKLGEKVLGNCSAKLKPYLMDAIKSMGMSPNDYSKIVASICQETSDTAEHNDDSVSGEHLAEERSLPEMIDSEKPPQLTEELNPEAVCQTEVGLEKSPKAVTSNGDAQNVNDDLSAGVDSTKEEENCQPSSQVAEVEPVPLDPKISESETMRDEPVKKKRGRKPNVSVQTPETSGQSKVEGDTETDLPVQGRSSDSKEDDTSPSEEQSVNKSAVLSVPEKEVVEQVTLPTAPRDEPVKVALPSPTKNLPDGGRAKRGRPARVKKGNLKEDTDHGSPSVLKEALSSEHVESDAVVSADAVSKVGSEGELKTEEKMNEQVAKKELSDKEKSDGATSDSEEKPLKRSSKKVDMKDNKDEGSSAKKEGEKAKRGRPKSLPGKDLAGESSNKKTGSSLKPPEKSTSEKETPSTKSKRKRTPAKETSENKDHGEDLVGSLIRVWWPDDKKFYQGVVDSFDPSSNKHKISYIDGDEEILLLKEERWKLVEDHTVANKGQSTDPSSPDASSEMPQKKKAKANSASGSNLAKTNTPSNKGKEISASKSKVEATKSSRRSKNDGKKAGDSTSKSAAGANNDNIGKSKGSTPKSGTKAKDDSPKTGTKSKVDTPKIGTKSKDATPKTGTKSKDETPKAETKSEDDTAKTRTKSKKETPKTGSKSKANGTSAKGKTGPSRGEETDTVEGKAHESETKSGRKRRR